MLDKAQLIQKWLLLRIRYEGWPESPRLPPIRDLATEWSVPASLVVEVLRGLVKRGVLRRNASRRYEVRYASVLVSESEPSESAPTEKDACSSWLKTYDRIRDDLASGLADPSGRLPPYKRLVTKYLCNPRTLRKALERLADEGLLVRAARGYRYSQSVWPGHSRHSCVYLTGYSAAMRSFLAQHHSFIRSAEQETQRLGGELRLFMSDDPGKDPLTPAPENVAGFITLASERPERGYAWIKFFEQNSKIPLVVLDPPERAKSYGRQARLCKMLPDNHRAGREIGLHLIRDGHHHAAFFSPFLLEKGWASLRLAGLHETIHQAGARMYVYISDTAHQTTLPQQHSQTVYHHLGAIYSELTVPDCLDREVVKAALREPYGLVSSLQARASLEKAFTSAFQQGCTAWICLHDGVAAVAWSFLKRNEALDKVKLVGFDNSPIAYSLQFSSYDFGYDIMGRAAVQWLVTPGRSRLIQRIPGQLLIRGPEARKKTAR